MLFLGIIGVAIVIILILRYVNSQNGANQEKSESGKIGRYYDMSGHDAVDVDIDQLYFDKLKNIDWSDKNKVKELKELEKTRNLLQSLNENAVKTNEHAKSSIQPKK